MAGRLKASVRSLLEGVFDYAGLFPPASLGLIEAAARYAEYRESEHGWMLGSFVVPAAQLGLLAPHIARARRQWPVTALCGPTLDEDLAAIEQFMARANARVDTLEVKASLPAHVETLRARTPQKFGVFVEVPLTASALLDVIRKRGMKAKLRSGGLTPDAIPSAASVAGFLAAAAGHRVAFKATAGLHHPLRCTHTLTYAPDSPTGRMHGFLNVLLAAILARLGASVEELTDLLMEDSADAFQFEDDGVVWRYHRLTNAQIRDCRKSSLVAIGSCSFCEPVEELAALGLL